MPENSRRRLRERLRRPDLLDRALGRVLDALHEAGGREMRIVLECLDPGDRHRRQVVLFEQRQPLRGRAAGQHLGQHRVGFVEVQGPRGLVGEARVVLPDVQPADRLEEAAPLPVVVDQHADEAVARAVGPAVRRDQPAVAGRAGRRVEGQPAEVIAQDDLRHRLEHRHLDVLPFAGSLAMQQRSQQCVHGIQPGDPVGDHRGHVARRLVAGQLEHRRHAAGRLDQVVVGRPARVGAVAPVADQPHVDDPRVHPRDVGVGQTQACHRGRTDVVDDRVGALAQPQQRVSPLGPPDVERHAALVAIGVQEERPHVAVPLGTRHPHHVALGRLDLDHVGAVVGRDLRGVRPHQHRRHVHDAKTAQRAGGPGLIT